MSYIIRGPIWPRLLSALGASLVGYRLKNFVNAKLQTIFERLGRAADVCDFAGVDPSGVLDSTVGINNALAVCKRLRFGDASIFKISGALNLSNDHRIFLGASTINQTASQTPAFNAVGRSGVRIVGPGKIVGVLESPFVNSASSQAIGIKADSAVDLEVTGVTFENWCYSPLMCASGGNGIRFSGNRVKGPGVGVLSDINFRNCTGVTIIGQDVVISENQITATAQGLIVGQGSQDVVIKGNIIRNIPIEHGMYVDTGVRSVVIAGNVVDTVRHTGIKVQHYDEFGVEPDTVSITGNTVSGTTVGDGILVLSTSATKNLKIKGLSISGNTCTAIAQDGISVRAADGASVTGNTVRGAGRAGIYLEDDIDCTVGINSIRECQQNGVFMGAGNEDIHITSNTMRRVGLSATHANGLSSGILVNAGGGHCIKGNVVSGGHGGMRYGLFIAGGDQTTMVVGENVFRGAETVGARFKNAAESLQWLGDNLYLGAVSNHAAENEPTGVQRGAMTAKFTSSVVTAPTTGTWPQGATIEAKYPQSDGFIGWTCVVGGTPGTWRRYGKILAT